MEYYDITSFNLSLTVTTKTPEKQRYKRIGKNIPSSTLSIWNGIIYNCYKMFTGSSLAQTHFNSTPDLQVSKHFTKPKNYLEN